MDLLSDIAHLPFFIIATAAVLCSLSMIFNPNLIRAGFTLIGSFVAIAGLYFLLAANFVAVSQVLIYAVGIVLVIIFAVMLCSLQQTASDVTNEEDLDVADIKGRKIVAALLCTGLFILMVRIIQSQDWWAIAHVSGAETHMQLIPQIAKQYTAQIGNLMLSRYVLPFELISVLLLIVLVGVIILSKREIETKEESK